MVLGESGSGKSRSLKHLDPQQTLLIQTIAKPLPFRSAGWTYVTKANPAGSILVRDDSAMIIKAMQRTARPVIVIDDFQYILVNEFMRRSDEKGFQKFSDIARHAWDVLMAAAQLDDPKRCYVLSHTNTDEAGNTRAKTIGKLLDEKVTLEGLVTVVLRSTVTNGVHEFRTRNSGSDTTKTPEDMFSDESIPNDLKFVDDAIVDYFGLIHHPAPSPA